MKIRIDAISSKGIDQYNILRIGPDGERLPINGIDWQDSNVFSPVPPGGGYVLQVRDIEGNIAEKKIPKEEPLKIMAYGGYIHDGSIIITAATNIPSQMHLSWSLDSEGQGDNILGWNGEFSQVHMQPLPLFYMNSEHHYWIQARSKYGQIATVNGRYVLTPAELDTFERFGPSSVIQMDKKAAYKQMRQTSPLPFFASEFKEPEMESSFTTQRELLMSKSQLTHEGRHTMIPNTQFNIEVT